MAQYVWGDTPAPLPELDHITVDDNWTKFLPEGSKIIYNKGHGASLWSQAGKISVELGDGTVKSFFIKLTGTDVGKHVAHAEFVAMSRLHEYIPESTPKPIGWGSFANKPDQCFYMCDFKDLVGDSLPSPRDFCTQIAAMHMASQADQANPDMFGYEHVTCDGPVVMPNTWSLSWEAHFLQKLKDTFVLDEQVHGECDDYAIIKPILYDKVIPRLLRPLETGGNSIKPTFCHGDLYHFNVCSQAEQGSFMIFDPAALWAHNEYDLKQWNATRYVFDKAYVDEYRKLMPPSSPAKDADDRLALYSVYNNLISSIVYPTSTRYRQFAIDGARGLIEKFKDGYTGTCLRKGEEMQRACETDDQGAVDSPVQPHFLNKGDTVQIEDERDCVTY